MKKLIIPILSLTIFSCQPIQYEQPVHEQTTPVETKAKEEPCQRKEVTNIPKDWKLVYNGEVYAFKYLPTEGRFIVDYGSYGVQDWSPDLVLPSTFKDKCGAQSLVDKYHSQIAQAEAKKSHLSDSLKSFK